MTCPVNVSLSGGYPDGRTGAGAKNPPSLRRSEVYPFIYEKRGAASAVTVLELLHGSLPVR